MWATWTHRNNIVFKNKKCNPTYVLELTKKCFYETIACNGCNNFASCSEATGSNQLDAGKSNNLKNWTPPPIGWVKYSMDASKSTANPIVTIRM